MDGGMASHKKRGGRPAAKLSTSTPQQNAESCTMVSPDSISATCADRVDPKNSPTSTSTAATTAFGSSAECRRSSRKKIIKFDVRDLLNKNRKPHKIQIEARIDSNAPTATNATSSGAASSSSCLSIPSAAQAPGGDLTSKQKTFIEKSAIFRRYSISSADQQNKVAAAQRPLPPVAKLTNAGDDSYLIEAERTKIMQARRLSRTQEIFNASMLKSKMNSSLIIAQMESSSGHTSSFTNIQRIFDSTGTYVTGKRRPCAAAIKGLGSNVTKRQIAPNARAEEDPKSSSSVANTAQGNMQKRRGRPPKNKAPVTTATTTRTTTAAATTKSTKEPARLLITPEKAKNWQEYKAFLKGRHHHTEPQPNSSISQSDVILEISSSESESESDVMLSPPNNGGTTKQRNFAAVSFLQEISSNVNDTRTAPEFIVAAVEEIIAEPIMVDSCESTRTQQTQEQLHKSESDGLTVEKASENSKSAKTENISVEKETKKPLNPIVADIRCSPNRKGSFSSSESETNSERSLNKVYKHGDKLRVTLKRLSSQELSPKGIKLIPTSPTTSACSSSSFSSTTSSPNSKISDTSHTHIKKRLKRLQKQRKEESLSSSSQKTTSCELEQTNLPTPHSNLDISIQTKTKESNYTVLSKSVGDIIEIDLNDKIEDITEVNEVEIESNKTPEAEIEYLEVYIDDAEELDTNIIAEENPTDIEELKKGKEEEKQKCSTYSFVEPESDTIESIEILNIRDLGKSVEDDGKVQKTEETVEILEIDDQKDKKEEVILTKNEFEIEKKIADRDVGQDSRRDLESVVETVVASRDLGKETGSSDGKEVERGERMDKAKKDDDDVIELESKQGMKKDGKDTGVIEVVESKGVTEKDVTDKDEISSEVMETNKQPDSFILIECEERNETETINLENKAEQLDGRDSEEPNSTEKDFGKEDTQPLHQIQKEALKDQKEEIEEPSENCTTQKRKTEISNFPTYNSDEQQNIIQLEIEKETQNSGSQSLKDQSVISEQDSIEEDSPSTTRKSRRLLETSFSKSKTAEIPIDQILNQPADREEGTADENIPSSRKEENITPTTYSTVVTPFVEHEEIIEDSKVDFVRKQQQPESISFTKEETNITPAHSSIEEKETLVEDITQPVENESSLDSVEEKDVNSTAWSTTVTPVVEREEIVETKTSPTRHSPITVARGSKEYLSIEEADIVTAESKTTSTRHSSPERKSKKDKMGEHQLGIENPDIVCSDEGAFSSIEKMAITPTVEEEETVATSPHIPPVKKSKKDPIATHHVEREEKCSTENTLPPIEESNKSSKSSSQTVSSTVEKVEIAKTKTHSTRRKPITSSRKSRKVPISKYLPLKKDETLAENASVSDEEALPSAVEKEEILETKTPDIRSCSVATSPLTVRKSKKDSVGTLKSPEKAETSCLAKKSFVNEAVASIVEKDIADISTVSPQQLPTIPAGESKTSINLFESRSEQSSGRTDIEKSISSPEYSTLDIPVVEKEEIVETDIIQSTESTEEPKIAESTGEPKIATLTEIDQKEVEQQPTVFTNIQKSSQSDETITLPPKKQLRKLQFADTRTDTPPDATKLTSLVPQITEQCNVETNTLLNILKTVQSNETAAAAAAAAKASNTESNIKASRTSDGDSPARSSPINALVVKKTTTARRYERRRRGGDEDSVHKTLEETFAEIAAESSKAIMEMFSRRHDEEGETSKGDHPENATIAKEDMIEKVSENDMKKEDPIPSTATEAQVYSEPKTESSAQHAIILPVDSNETLPADNIERQNLETKATAKETSTTETTSTILIEKDVTVETSTEEKTAENKSEIMDPQASLKPSTLPDTEVVIKSAKRGRRPKAKPKEPLPTTEGVKGSEKVGQTGNKSKKRVKSKETKEGKDKNTSAQDTISNETDTKNKEKYQKKISKNTTESFEKSKVVPNILKIQKEAESRIDVPKVDGECQGPQDISSSIENSTKVESSEKPEAAIARSTDSEGKNTISEIAEKSREISQVKEKVVTTDEKEKTKETHFLQEGNIRTPTIETAATEIKTLNIGCDKVLPLPPPKKRYLKAQRTGLEDSISPKNIDTTTGTNTAKKNPKKTTKTTAPTKKDVTHSKNADTTTAKRGPKAKQKLPSEAQTEAVTSKPRNNKKNLKKATTEKATNPSLEVSTKVEKTTNPSLEPSAKPAEKKTKTSNKKKSSDTDNGKTISVTNTTAKKKRKSRLKDALEANFETPPSSRASNPCDDMSGDETMTPSDTKHIEGVFSSTPNKFSHNLPPTPTNFESNTSAVSSGMITPQSSLKAVSMVSSSGADPDDPLKDIEEFIEAGVNLLKRGYKIENEGDDSVDGTTLNQTKKLTEKDLVRNGPKDSKAKVSSKACESQDHSEDSGLAESSKECLLESTDLRDITSFAETPAGTPLATPTVTPPPSCAGTETPPLAFSDDSLSAYGGVRRSHRIKQNAKTPKALVGRGLVRDKERLSLKDDVETKTAYTIDDHRTDLAEVEAKNAKFLKDMEERLSNFRVIKENEYKCERVISKEAKKMICDCFLTAEEEGRGELACGEDCLNRLLMIECGPDCNVKDRCTNKRFQKLLCSPCRVFRTEKKGFGIMADIEILPGEFIMEYVGEVIDSDEFERRRMAYSLEKNRHYYFMALRSDAIIDATSKGNISRFINHSCDPNAETQKWTVNGELRIGFFSKKSIMPGEEITFNYQYQRYGREAQRCYCESSNCSGWIGQEPNSDEGEQIVGNSDGDEEEDENLTEGLMGDDDEDSDETDAEVEVHKNLESVAAEVKLVPVIEGDKKEILEKPINEKKKKPEAGASVDGKRSEVEEHSKNKFQTMLSKMVKKKRKNQKERTRKQSSRREDSPRAAGATKLPKSRYLEDPDIEDEVHFLSRSGLKNQSDTLRLSRLMVRAKLVQTRLNLLKILRSGDLPCRRLFLDYHGLRLLHGWMSEDGKNLNIRMAMLETLASLPIANKTMLTDSKVYQAVRSWCSNEAGTEGAVSSLSPSDESSKESTSSQPKASNAPPHEVSNELKNLALKLTATWDSLPEVFRIPKRERIEQMKEHEREADRQCAVTTVRNEVPERSNTDPYQRDRFGRGGGSNGSHRFTWTRGGAKEPRNISVVGSAVTNTDPRRRGHGLESSTYSSAYNTKYLSKEQRREMFAAKVARDEAEKRKAEERREFETKCRFFGLDPKKTRPQDVPLSVDPRNGQWYSAELQPLPTPPSYAHVQVPDKSRSTNPADYKLPEAVAKLPHKWKCAITPQGKLYYYHVQHRVPQWEPPTPEQMYGSRARRASELPTASDSGSDTTTDIDDELLKTMDPSKLQEYVSQKVEIRRNQRYAKLVVQRAISPRREEDHIYNQIEVRKYKENKDKIRRRKEDLRRRRIEAMKNPALNMCTLGSLHQVPRNAAGSTYQGVRTESSDTALPIQDYLLSSDEEENIKEECNNSPLLAKIVQGDKIVDELDALTTNRTLKRPLPPHREMEQSTGSSGGSAASIASRSASAAELYDYKKRKIDKRESSKSSYSAKRSKEQDSKYRKMKEKFRCEIAGIIVHYLKQYRKDSCLIGRIKSSEDFNHLARKLTHFVMIKELKYCESVGQTLVVTESVKNKSREFIKKYMSKYGEVYVKPPNDPEFKSIPYSL